MMIAVTFALPSSRSEAQHRSLGIFAIALSRRPIVRPGRSATSTQFPLEKLNELLTQRAPESGFNPGRRESGGAVRGNI